MNSAHTLSILFINIADQDGGLFTSKQYKTNTRTQKTRAKLKMKFLVDSMNRTFFNKQALNGKNNKKLSQKKTRNDCMTRQTEKFIHF